MVVFFSCSTDKILQYKEEYLTIVDTIKKLGYEMSRDWVNKSVDLAEKNKQDVSRDILYSEVMSAILAADVAIFDCTVQSMSIGHQLTFALDKGKPTLLIAKKNNESIENLFISGNKTGYLTLKNYNNLEDIESIVKEFLSKNLSKDKTRFQLVFKKPQREYIEWANYKYKKNKSDIVNNAIDEKADRDEAYQKYLLNRP